MRQSHHELGAPTRGVGTSPSWSQAQRVAAPRRRGFVVCESWRRSGRGRGAAGPLRNLPQLMGQRGLALGDGPLGPGGLHIRQFTCMSKQDGEKEEKGTGTVRRGLGRRW